MLFRVGLFSLLMECCFWFIVMVLVCDFWVDYVLVNSVVCGVRLGLRLLLNCLFDLGCFGFVCYCLFVCWNFVVWI